jgi:hypothetical protein
MASVRKSPSGAREEIPTTPENKVTIGTKSGIAWSAIAPGSTVLFNLGPMSPAAQPSSNCIAQFSDDPETSLVVVSANVGGGPGDVTVAVLNTASGGAPLTPDKDLTIIYKKV